MPLEVIRYETDGPIAIIPLDRPDKLNAISTQMIRELNRALDRAEGDSDVRVIVLRREGKAFSAGFDLGGGERTSVRLESMRCAPISSPISTSSCDSGVLQKPRSEQFTNTVSVARSR
jgi:enoyl-CoA hydratase/carnithine racemase